VNISRSELNSAKTTPDGLSHVIAKLGTVFAVIFDGKIWLFDSI